MKSLCNQIFEIRVLRGYHHVLFYHLVVEMGIEKRV